ncbi:MAG: cadmium-translocating P-type ATPase, partial [Clostridia bacterium]|nr:cadmium-translocating P-type ATPase [Clostridia bacterium]
KDECGCGHCGHDHDHEHDHDHDDDDDDHDHDHDHGDNDGESFRPRVIRIAAGAAVYLCGVILGERFGTLPHILIIAAAYVILGYDVVIRALRNLFRGRVFDENFLMTLSTVCAFLIGSTTEAAAVMLFYQIGELFQDMAVDRSRRSITELMDIRPDTATVLRGGEWLTVHPDDAAVGETVMVRPGEKIPLDGDILEGRSHLDTRALTGESVPREVCEGDHVLSGCVNGDGVLKIRVTHAFAQSTASRILELTKNAASRKAKSEKFITRFARWYTPAVVVFAFLLAVIPPLFDGQWANWIRRGCVTLVVSCPCALVISVPLTFFGGIGAASKKGVLVKGSCWLETLDQVKTVVFDKTGTITEGVFDVVSVQPEDGVTADELMNLALHAEHYSDHPIAKSVRRCAGAAADEAKLADYREIFGHGIRVLYDDAELLAGNERLMEQYGVNFTPAEDVGTHLYIAYRGRFMGSLTAADRMKPHVRETIADLKHMGVEKTVMLTGDDAVIAGNVASDAGIDEFYAGLLPDDKLNLLEKLMTDGKTTAFIGDGINDAPALARADVGIAMAGLDAAMEAGDVVLMNSDPAAITEAVRIARRTRRIVTQNIVFSLAVKGVFIILGAIGISGMWEAVFGDVGVMVIAVLNAMRILRNK